MLLHPERLFATWSVQSEFRKQVVSQSSYNYSGLLKPFNEYADEELLTMKDAYKEGDPMYWLSKNDPLYIDWNIPEKRGTNVDRNEC